MKRRLAHGLGRRKGGAHEQHEHNEQHGDQSAAEAKTVRDFLPRLDPKFAFDYREKGHRAKPRMGTLKSNSEKGSSMVCFDFGMLGNTFAP
jgi:hypothetical protein